MKQLLLATTILAASAGVAAAEITLSGSAVMGVGETGEGTVSKMETYVTFAGAGETDSGLSFGLSSTMATYEPHADDFANDGTSVFISGAFGKLTMGDVDEADKVVGFDDIGGIGGIGVDNVAEALVGAGEHDVNYSYAAGPVAASISGLIGQGDEPDSWALGGRYSMGDAYLGLGYNDTDATTTASVYAGSSFGAVSVAALWSQADTDGVGNSEAWGLYAAYTMDALTLTAEYADSDAVTDAAYGLGASYDLGGGAVVSGGLGSVDDATVWEAGVSLSF